MRNDDEEARRARDVAAELIESGKADEPLAAGADLRPIPLESRDRTVVGWVVAVVVAGRLLGFVQLDQALRFQRYASFVHGTRDPTRAPQADDWLDPDVILRRARTRVDRDDLLSQPFLGYDSSPDRVAWVVRVTQPDGTERVLLVAGEEVIEPRDAAEPPA